MAFAGLEPSFENHEEGRLIEEFWDFYQNKRRILNQQNFLKRDVLERLTKRDLGMRDGVDIFV